MLTPEQTTEVCREIARRLGDRARDWMETRSQLTAIAGKVPKDLLYSEDADTAAHFYQLVMGKPPQAGPQ